MISLQRSYLNVKNRRAKRQNNFISYFFLKIVMNCHLTVVDSSQSMTENLSLLC